MKLVPGTKYEVVAQIIKTQREILGFKLKIRKGKQPASRETFYLHQNFRPNESEFLSHSTLLYIPL